MLILPTCKQKSSLRLRGRIPLSLRESTPPFKGSGQRARISNDTPQLPAFVAEVATSIGKTAKKKGVENKRGREYLSDRILSELVNDHVGPAVFTSLREVAHLMS